MAGHDHSSDPFATIAKPKKDTAPSPAPASSKPRATRDPFASIAKPSSRSASPTPDTFRGPSKEVITLAAPHTYLQETREKAGEALGGLSRSLAHTATSIQSQADSLDPEYFEQTGQHAKARIARAYKAAIAPAGKSSANYLSSMTDPSQGPIILALHMIPTSGLGAAVHASLGSYFAGKMGMEGVRQAYESYKAAYRGETPVAVERGMDALFNLGTATDIGKGAARGLAKARRAPEIASRTTREGAQWATGAGTEDVAAAMRKHGEDVRQAAAKHAEDVAQAKADYKALMDRHESDIRDINEKHAGDVAKRDELIRKSQSKFKADSQRAYDKWMKAARAARAEAAGGEQAAQSKLPVTSRYEVDKPTPVRKREIKRAQVEYAKRAQRNIADTYARIKTSFNDRWRQQREFVQDYAQVDTAPVLDAIGHARDELAGTPDSKPILDQLEHKFSKRGEGFDTAEGVKPAPAPQDFDSAYNNASALASAASSSSVPKVRYVLYKVHDALMNELGGAVERAAVERAKRERGDATGSSATTDADTAAGTRARAQFDALRSDYRQFKTDWDDSDGALAKAKDAVGPRKLVAIISADKDGNIPAALARYTEHEADPKFVDEIRTLGRDLEGRVTEAPVAPYTGAEGGIQRQLTEASVEPIKRPEPPVEPAPVPAPEYPPRPEYVEPEPKPVAPVDPYDMRLRQLEKVAKSGIVVTDVIYPWRIFSKQLMRFPKVREWVASQARPGDPDYIPPERRTPMSHDQRVQMMRDARDAYQLLYRRGNAIFNDYARGQITAEGFRQRVKAIVPGISTEELDGVVARAERAREEAAAASRK